MLRVCMRPLKGLQKLWIGLLVAVTLLLIIRVQILFLGTSTKSVPKSSLFRYTQQFVNLDQQIVSARDIAMLENYPTAKWIVLDGMTSSCNDIREFTGHLEWRVIMVSSRTTQVTGCRFPRCILLNENTSKSFLGTFAVSKLVERPTKLSGFLLAMSFGAQVIVDAKCTASTNELSINQHPFWDYPDLPAHALLYNQTQVFNPFQHFGYEKLSPKMFRHLSKPESILPNSSDCHLYEGRCRGHHTNSNMYFLQDVDQDTLWQSVSVSHATCPYDTISKKTLADVVSSISPVSVGSNTIAPLDTGFTLFPRNKFSWMFVPVYMSEEEQDMFRTIFVHSVRSHLSLSISFVNDKGCSKLSSYSCLINKTAEDLLINSNVVSNLELNHLCHAAIDKQNSSACATKLLIKIVDLLINANKKSNPDRWKGVLDLFNAWLDDLSKLDVAVLKNSRSIESGNGFKIKYSFQVKPFELNDSKQSKYVSSNVFDKMHKVCSSYTDTPSLTLANWKTPIIHDIMLIIVLNYDFLFETLPYLEYLYRSSFKYIVYCGPKVEEFNVFAWKNGFSYVTYIDGFTHSWHFMYECMTHAMKLRLPVKGYLQIGDDVLLNVRKLSSLSRHRIWMPLGFTKRHLFKTQTSFDWFHWQTPFGRPAILSIFHELQVLSSSRNTTQLKKEKRTTFDQSAPLLAVHFLNNYDKNIGRNSVIHRAIDIFYIPELLRNDYIWASELFRRHKSMIELAVPVIHLGLVPKSDVIYMKGASLWRKDRDQSWKFYNGSTTFFVHPFKSLSHIKTSEGKEFFCLNYLPKLVNSVE